MAGNDLGSLLGGLLGGGQQSGGGAGGGANLLAVLLGTLMRSGGTTGAAGSNPLGGLLEMLTKSGLVDQAQSWVGSGSNQPVSGSQLRQALPDETLRQVAEEAGVSPEQAADGLAQVLPQAVDRLTPEGQVPQESLEDIIRQQRL